MIRQFNANQARLRRHHRIRRRLEGSEERPRLSVFRSGQHIYAQLIDDSTGRTVAAASSLEEALRSFQVTPKAAAARSKAAVTEEAPVEMAAEVAPAKGKGARVEKAAPKPQAKGTQQQKGAPGKGGKPAAQVKTLLPTAEKGVARTPVEALAAIADNRKVAIAREVGKLVAQRAKEKGVSRVVFDRSGYAYHGRIAALAEGAREVGLNF
jgi:large subunit ribosomal protein L18